MPIRSTPPPSLKVRSPIEIPVFAGYSSTQGTWILKANAGMFGGGEQSNDIADADGDNIAFSFFVERGTYDFYWLYGKHGSCGICDVDLDGVEKASFDAYAAVGAFNFEGSITGESLTSGEHTLNFRIDGKNGASGGWFLRLQKLMVVRA